MLLEKIDCDSSDRKPDVHTSARTTPLVTQLILPESTQLCPCIQQNVLSSESLHVACARSVFGLAQTVSFLSTDDIAFSLLS